MNIIINPSKSKWDSLTQRPYTENNSIVDSVKEIFKNVKKNGDKSIIDYTLKFDNVKIDKLKVSENLINDSEDKISSNLKKAIDLAYNNIYKFHSSQLQKKNIIEVQKGINCWQEKRPINNVGLYIPGGSAPLFSTVLMLGIPSLIANCVNRILCTPPNFKNEIAPEILYACKVCGINNIFKVGGAQAIAAMTFGTESIPKIDKIFGPGNQYVTEAKKYSMNYGLSIDMPAGPSELLVLADDSANPKYVASDLLSQAEHGIDSQVILVSNSKALIDKVSKEINIQKEDLSRKEIITKSLENSKSILFDSIDDSIDFINEYAPEHYIINTSNEEYCISKLSNAGSVFIGNFTPESAGDYASGTNHTLPTNGYAKQYSGVNTDSFLKTISFQKISKSGLMSISNAIETMALSEGLDAHKQSVSIRINEN
ncbi:MAG: histidinol dehydrogenase [Flavobacteriaceae bacterium]|tara:strand:- start:2214 stop:3494 length:1281 start_codon:yes stop_codon:yes gene_type:complete